jgi:UDP-N-acetylmuramoyl-L-alanyl-D-glutamate--2,6-diaminopimelate ligase
MKKLSDILYKVPLTAITGNTDVDVKEVQIDSRKVQPGSLFIAVKGVAVDGHQYIIKAAEMLRLLYVSRFRQNRKRV